MRQRTGPTKLTTDHPTKEFDQGAVKASAKYLAERRAKHIAEWYAQQIEARAQAVSIDDSGSCQLESSRGATEAPTEFSEWLTGLGNRRTAEASEPPDEERSRQGTSEDGDREESTSEQGECWTERSATQ